MALVGVIGQVGCLTLVIILAALIAGLWLDNQFQTRPLFALVLVLASVPITIFLMFRVVLSFAPRIQAMSAQAVEIDKEEEPEGGDDPANQP
jgi:F0F1-type ATP synthase assembly protein I